MKLASSGLGPRRLLAFTALFLLLSAAGGWVVFNALAGNAFSFDARLLEADALLALAALMFVYFTADGLRLLFTLKALGYTVPWQVMTRLVFINIFFSNVTPLATGGGFAQIWFLQRHGVPLGIATTAATVRTLLAMAFIFTAAPMLFLVLVPADRVSLESGSLFYLGVFLAVYVAFFAILLFRTRWFAVIMDALVGLLWQWRVIGTHRHRRWQFASKRELLRFARGFGQYARGDRANVLLSIAFTMLFLAALFSFPAVLLWALDYDVAWQKSAGLAAVATFVMYFSPTPGASGIAEGVFGHLFRGTVGAGHLLLVTLAWRFFTIHAGMIAGVFATHVELTRGGKQACADAVVSKPSST